MGAIEIPASITPSLAQTNGFHPRHVVQFYAEDPCLLDALGRSVGGALGSGGAAIVIATPEHREELSRRLAAFGIDALRAVKQGRYVPIDALETLSRFMREGIPDEALFVEALTSVMEPAFAATGSSHQPILAFGEMVALLWAQENAEAAIRLEQLWNNLAQTYSFSLLCAYPLGGFRRVEDQELFLRICGEHTGVLPAETYSSLGTEEERLQNVASLQQRAQVLQDLSRAHKELQESEERYRLLVECVKDYAIFMLSPKGHILSWNQGAQRIKGYSYDEIVGRHFSLFYPPEDIQAGKPNRELEIAAEEGRFEDVGWRLRKDGSRFWANVIITALRDPAGELKGFAKVTRDITERKRAEDAIRDLSGRLLRAQDEARRRLARELHDSAAQTLSALSLNLALMGTYGEIASQARPSKTLTECARLVDEAAREIRTFSYLLHPPALDDATLGSALRWYVDGFGQRTKMRVEFEVSPGLERLPEDAEAALFRVAQEALTNVYRHSGSRVAGVRLALGEGEIALEVWDQGKGFSTGMLEDGEASAKLGVGIRGMRERLQQLGGRLQIQSGPTGTRVTAILPVSEQTVLPSEGNEHA
jgi:PAS domain S-box-containing protein